MLTIIIPRQEGYELFDPVKNEFVPVAGIDHELVLHLEHSLVSLQKWEEKYHKSFLSTTDKSEEESKYYVYCMCIEDVPEYIFDFLTAENYREISKYLEDPHTATTIKQDNSKRSREIITAEIIYYWMTALQIPAEYRYWNLNQLLTLIQVCNIKNQPPKKMGKKDMVNSNRALNAARKKKLGTHG